MNFSVKPIAPFERQAKYLIKKYPSLKKELFELGQSLQQDPEQGTPLGYHCYKIRLAIASKGKGKSGGARDQDCSAVQLFTDQVISCCYLSKKRGSENSRFCV